MDAKEATKAVVWGAPPLGVSLGSFAGLPLQQWVYVVTIVYTLIHIGLLFPRVIGCGVCFWKHGTCNLSCKENKK